VQCRAADRLAPPDASNEDLHRLCIAEDDHLPTVKHRTKTAPLRLCPEQVPSHDPFHIPRLALDHAALRACIGRKQMGKPPLRFEEPGRVGTQGATGEEVFHALNSARAMLNIP